VEYRYYTGDNAITEMPDGKLVRGWVYQQMWGSYGWPGRYLTSFFHSITDATIDYADTDVEKIWSSIQHVRCRLSFPFGHEIMLARAVRCGVEAQSRYFTGGVRAADGIPYRKHTGPCFPP
jgi:hypothetical protein